MTKYKFEYLMKLAAAAGINTLGELAAFKTEKRARTNSDLFVELYQHNRRENAPDRVKHNGKEPKRFTWNKGA